MGNQASGGGGGDTDHLLKLRQDLLHTTDSGQVRNTLEKLVLSGSITASTIRNNDAAINILKYVARIHGFGPGFRVILQELLTSNSDVPSKGKGDESTPCFKYKVSLALKYAVRHGKDFIKLSQLLSLLLDEYPLDQIHKGHGLDFFTQESITQILLSIITILNPDRVSSEKIPEAQLWKLENYLAYINGKYKSEVRRCLEKMGYWSGSVGQRQRLKGSSGSKGGQLFRSGDQIISSVQKRKGFNVSAHVVKTQQTEAVTTEENISEKTQIANISLSNALEHGRARTMVAARTREKLPQLKGNKTGSDQGWFATTSTEVTKFWKKARGGDVIKTDDLDFLKKKFNGFRFSFSQDDYEIVEMIAETFAIASKTQKLSNDTVLHLLNIALEDNFQKRRVRVADAYKGYGQISLKVTDMIGWTKGASEKMYSQSTARKHILEMTDNHCNREGEVYAKIHQSLTKFEEGEEGKKETEEIKAIIWKIMSGSDKFAKENLGSAIAMLEDEKRCMIGLNYIQQQIANKERQDELEKKEDLIPSIFQVLESFDERADLISKALEVLEDYLQLSWTGGFSPEDISSILNIAEVEEATQDVVNKGIRCILRSLEKGLINLKYFEDFSEDQLENVFRFLFKVISEDMECEYKCKILTLVMLSNSLKEDKLKRMARHLGDGQIDYFREKLKSEDVILTSKGEIVPEDELPDDAYLEEEEHEYVSTIVAQLLVTILEEKADLLCDELTIATVSQVLLKTGAKNTKIFCAEFLFRVASSRRCVFSPPVLNRIQPETFSPVADVRVYITAAYATSLANQEQTELEAEQVNFLVNLYSFKKVTLDKEDFTEWINPKILATFFAACSARVEFSEQVFHLVANILNNTCADSEQSPDYPTVKSILDMVTSYCSRQAGELPSSIVDAVENLLLESDVFDETCAGIVEECMVAGRWVSEPVVEEFAKYLWHEPKVSLPMLRRLSIANENQELPTAIFESFQMELIAVRLFPSQIHPEGVTVLKHQHLEQGGDRKELFQCLIQYVGRGLRMSHLSIEVAGRLLSEWKGGKGQINDIVRCLTSVASNGQSLPQKLIESALELGESADLLLQLDFATAVVRRSQPLPNAFLEFLHKQMKTTKTKDFVGNGEGSKIFALARTLIQHNQSLPDEVIQSYCNALKSSKNLANIPDNLSSLIRLVEGGLVKGDMEMKTCLSVFIQALDSNNSTLGEMGEHGLAVMPTSSLDAETLATLDARGIALITKESQDESRSSKEGQFKDLWKTIQTALRSPDQGKLKSSPKWLSTLEKALATDSSFVNKVGKLLREGKGPLKEMEVILIEMLCLTISSDNGDNSQIIKISKQILEDAVNDRKYNLNVTCRAYLSRLDNPWNEDQWARNFLKQDRSIDGALLTALGRWQDKPHGKKRTATLGRLFGDSRLFLEFNQEIMTTLEKVDPKYWEKVPNVVNPIAQSIILKFESENAITPAPPKSHLHILEKELVLGNGEMPSIIIQAYNILVKLDLQNKGNFDQCVQSLTEYLKNNQTSMTWLEKAQICEIIEIFSKRSEKLPVPVLNFILDGVISENDELLRAHCFSVLRILHKKKSPQVEVAEVRNFWTNLTQGNLYAVYKLVNKFVGEEDLQPSRFNLDLLQALQSLMFVDLKSLVDLDEDDWIEHLFVADTVLRLAPTIDEKLALFPVVKDFCDVIDNSVIFRLHIIHSLKDYLAQNLGTLTPSKILRLVNTSLMNEKDKEWSKMAISEPCGADWVHSQICRGLAHTLHIKMKWDASPQMISILIEQAISQPSPIPLYLMDRMISILGTEEKSIGGFFQIKNLFEYLKASHDDKDIILAQLKELREGDRMSPSSLLASLQASVIMKHLSKVCHDKSIAFARVTSHTKQLLSKSFNFVQIDKLFSRVVKAVKGKVVSPEVGLDILENLMYQMVAYRVSPAKFHDICMNIKEANVKLTEWVEKANELIMEHLYSGSQGVKTAFAIANEYSKLNKGKNSDKLKEFSKLASHIQQGRFKSEIFECDLEINEWLEANILEWAIHIKSLNEPPTESESSSFITESLAVISRACLLKRNYRLTPIQILSVYCTYWTEDKGTLLQVATGSGKSTIIVALAVIRSLMGHPVDVYTSSPVLAERDAKFWEPFYRLFGLSCDHNGDKGSGYIRGEKMCYKKDVVYGDTSQFQFDALRHEYSGLGTRAQRRYGYAIVDEVDSMFVDDSSKLARLSSTLPGMDLLQIMYHLIWQRLHDIQQRLYAVGKGTYYLEGARSFDDVGGNMYYTFLKRDGKEVTISNVPSFILHNQDNESELEGALIYKVEDIDTFVVDHLKRYTKALIGVELFDEGGKAVQAMSMPKPLINFAKSQVDNWVDSAMTAVAFQENVHYVVDRDQIKPVDYHSTGTIQASTNWNNGLHQFLQIKHALKVTTETVTTNFLSNMAMFQKYGSQLAGFTGTLGSQYGQGVLQEVYNVDSVIIPELYCKRFQELEEKLVRDQHEWVDRVAHSALHESAKKRGVLVICQTIKEADLIAEEIERKNTRGNRTSIKLYTRNDQNQEKQVEQVKDGDIIVATNLAGRGTDINTVKVEDQGGLHVILTFLPDSLRVEQQAFGRTARQGNKGSGELIVISPETSDSDVIKHNRDDKEEQRLHSFQTAELALIQTKDRLFGEFCKLYSGIREMYKNKDYKSSSFSWETFTNKVCKVTGWTSLSTLELTMLQAIEQKWAIFMKRIDDNEITFSDADEEYKKFENDILANYKDEDELINSTDNCFYWIQCGNEFYRRGNKWDDNTTKSYEYFEKAIKIDSEFAAGAYAGMGFTMLRGKSHWVWSNSHEGDYKNGAIMHLKRAQEILYTEIALYSTAQTLLQHRQGRMDSELFKQLTERVNLIGEYCQNIQGIISNVEKSLRRIYVTERRNDCQVTWKLEDISPDVKKESGKDCQYSLEFNHLTHRYDCGTKDQATDTIREFNNISLELHDQSLQQLTEDVKAEVSSINQVEFQGLKDINGVREFTSRLGVKTFTMKVQSAKMSLLEHLQECGLMARVSWGDSFSGERTRKTLKNFEVVSRAEEEAMESKFGRLKGFISKVKGGNDPSQPVAGSEDDEQVEEQDEDEMEIIKNVKAFSSNDIAKDNLKIHKHVPKGVDITVEGQFSTKFDLSLLKDSIGENPDISVIIKDLSRSTIEKYWTVPKSDPPEPGILQAFNRNTVIFSGLSNKKSKALIKVLREKHIEFILRLEGLSFAEAEDALKNSGREQEDIEERSVKEMGHQFSSEYVPFELIRELSQRGILLMPEFGEKLFVPWKSVIYMGIIASVQVAAGGLLICTGFGAPMGLSLITEGMSDFVTMHRIYTTRQCSWTDYAIQKAISLTISACTLGLKGLKDGAKGAKHLVQGTATEALKKAGEKVVTDESLNQTILAAGNNLSSLAMKQIAVQGCETVARTGLNACMDTLAQFSFDAISDKISDKIETTVKIEFRTPEFIDALGTCSVMDTNGGLNSKITGWMAEITNPKSGDWNKLWDKVGYPLCQGILSDPKYLGSKFSMGTRLFGMMHGFGEIVTITERVCGHVQRKLTTEGHSLTPAYAIQEEFGVTSSKAAQIIEKMTFIDQKNFEVKEYPDKEWLKIEFKIELEKLQSLFQSLHKAKKEFKPDNNSQFSRLVKSIVDHLTQHTIHVANRQLVSPVTTLAVGKLVSTISQEMQNKYLVNEDQLSKEQKMARELKQKDPSHLTPEEKALIQQNDRPLTITDLIRGNAKDLTVAFQQRDIIAVIQSITEKEKQKTVENPRASPCTKEARESVTNILDGKPADMTVVFLLAEMNDANVKIVGPDYQPTDEDKANGVKLMVYEKPENGQTVGHYAEMDTNTGVVSDIVVPGGGQDDCAYNVLSEITGKSPDELRLQAAIFIACNQEKFADIDEPAEWIKESYPEEANKLLFVGGRKGLESENIPPRQDEDQKKKIEEDEEETGRRKIRRKSAFPRWGQIDPSEQDNQPTDEEDYNNFENKENEQPNQGNAPEKPRRSTAPPRLVSWQDATREFRENDNTVPPVPTEIELNEDARKRANMPPSKSDGPGFIYMYTDPIRGQVDPNAEREVKIGFSKDDPTLRIGNTGSNNSTNYTPIFAMKVPYRKHAERVIHKQLQDCRTPRDYGDGKTEWFTGSPNELKETLKQVKRELRRYDFQ